MFVTYDYCHSLYQIPQMYLSRVTNVTITNVICDNDIVTPGFWTQFKQQQKNRSI
jgi:hypothetical protein